VDVPSPESTLGLICEQLGISAEYLRDHGFVPIPEPADHDLRVIAATPREIRLVAPVAEAWSSLRDAALRDGIVLIPISGFRSVDYQADLFRRKLKAGKTVPEILAVNAPPGFSEHHSGRALDLATPDSPPLEEVFADTAAFKWLNLNANHFGFRMSYPRDNPQGFVFEPWHWCWGPRV
jgi:D-alanyl-D-alanine carboxypeptidase